jgi:hypothetical protein
MRSVTCSVRIAVLAGALVALAGGRAAAQGLEYGAKGGVNFATLSLHESVPVSFDTRIGLVAGGFVTWPLTSRWSVQPEVLFSQKGATFDDTGAAGRIELDALDVPILARYRFGRLVAFGGPSLGFTLEARQVLEFGDEEESVDIGEDIESLDFGIAAGAAYEAGRLSVEGRYTFGLTNLNAISADEESLVKSRVFAVLVGYKF